jgi:hypothetical protein
MHLRGLCLPTFLPPGATCALLTFCLTVSCCEPMLLRHGLGWSLCLLLLPLYAWVGWVPTSLPCSRNFWRVHFLLLLPCLLHAS